MTGLLGTAAATLAAEVPVGEAIAFWILAPIALAAALGCILVRNAVHSALLLVATMACLAVFYALQEAPFLAVVQVIVYTGAIMILFLFVLMLIGVDSTDSLIETLRGQRVAAVTASVGFVLLLAGGLASATQGTPSQGLAAVNAEGNVLVIARLLFSRYVVAFEVVSALLITAALGAMVLAHRDAATGPDGRPAGRLTQKEMSRRRFDGSRAPQASPGPGVYARHNAVDRPALLPDGSPAYGSTPSSLQGRLPDRSEPTRSTTSVLDSGVAGRGEPALPRGADDADELQESSDDEGTDRGTVGADRPGDATATDAGTGSDLSSTTWTAGDKPSSSGDET